MSVSLTAVRPFNELVIVVVSTARGEITPQIRITSTRASAYKDELGDVLIV